MANASPNPARDPNHARSAYVSTGPRGTGQGRGSDGGGVMPPAVGFSHNSGSRRSQARPAGDELAVERHAVGDVDDGPERALRQSLSDRVRDTQAQVGERRADPALDEATYPRGSLDDRHQRGDVDLDGQGAEPARPPDEREAEADDVGTQRKEVAHDRFVVTRVLGTFGAEPVAVGAALGLGLFERALPARRS